MNKIISEYILASKPIKIDLGCGPNKKQGYIGIDHLPLPGVDIVSNFEDGLGFIPDNTVDEIVSSHLLEHIDNLENLLKEVHRVLKPDGIKKIVVPHFSNPYYYSDYTHRRFFGLYTFDYFSNGDNEYKRKVPVFYNDFKFEVVSRRLVFKNPPFRIIHTIRRVFNLLVNLSVSTQEFYEGSLTGIIPCTEIEFVIRPIKSPSSDSFIPN